MTLRRYWGNISISKSGYVRISGCSVYTENVKAEGGSCSGIGISSGSHDISIDKCLIDGNAWNSIGIGGRSYGVSGARWTSSESYNVSITGCESRNNSLHCLCDFMGISHYIYIANNRFHGGHSGSVYVHQGHPNHLYIAGNEISDSSDGIHCDGGVSDSIIEGNYIHGINPKGGHSLHIRTNKKYGDTVFTSDNNIVRKQPLQRRRVLPDDDRIGER